MERIKRSFFRFLPIFISTVLFFVPFFWFGAGGVNLGGDSSRLYLFDPVNYLKTFPLYSVAPGATGVESISFFFIPFTLLFVFFKAIFRDPHLVVNVYHGLMLAFSYLFLDLSVKKLFTQRTTDSNMAIAAAIGGLFYIFAPTVWNWDKAISSHNQIFLNPLNFFLILQFLLTDKTVYLLLVCFITLLFAPNFSFIAAPPLFSFYPMAMGYLFFYQTYIRKAHLNWKPLVLFGILFISIHAFHLLPQAAVILDKSSNASQRIFSATEIDSGLQYFLSISSGVKLSKNLIAEPISKGLPMDVFMFAAPFLIIISLLLLQRTEERVFPKKAFLLTLLFFLIALFFDTARITGIGLAFYSLLFKIPGFSMFRNFHGQFMYVYSFFYALVLGYSVYLVLLNMNRYKQLFVIGLFLILLLNGRPLWSGYMVNLPLLGIQNTQASMRVDPQFKETLTFIRNLPVDGKILTLPLTDPGYQMLSGMEGGMYIGPSIIGYVTGKKDFMGYQALQPFSDMFLEQFRTRDYEAMKALLARLNVKYIFYNSDPAIYDKRFSIFPYNTMMQYFPDQESVREFVDKLGVKKIHSQGTYSVFEIDTAAYLPHIFATQNTIFSSDPITMFSFLGNSLRSITAPIESAVLGAGEAYFQANLVGPLFELLNNYHLHRHDPFVTRKLSNPLYVFVLLKEKFEINRKKANPNTYLDFNLFYTTKRIAELEKYGREMPVNKQRGNEFYSWVAVLDRYEQGMAEVIRWMNEISESEFWKKTAHIKVTEQLYQHELRLQNAVRNGGKPDYEVEFLDSRVKQIIETLRKNITVPAYNPSSITYELNTGLMPSGTYQIYFENLIHTQGEPDSVSITSNGQKFSPIQSDLRQNFLDFGSTHINSAAKQNFILDYRPQNLASAVRWFGYGQSQKRADYQELIINNSLPDNITGLIGETTGLAPKTQYVITFSYKTQGNNFIFRLFNKETADNGSMITKPKSMKYFEKQFNSQEWQTHQSIWTTSDYPSNLYLQIIPNNSKPESTFLIKDLSVVEVAYPKLIFRRISDSAERIPVLPKITFAKINPTKYLVSVTSAVEPFTLVFSEEYNAGWKLYRKGSSAKGRGPVNYVADRIGNILTYVFSLVMRTRPEDPSLTASYFNGDVGELKSRDVFMDASTFETWGKQNIAAERHTIANGYANAWHVLPQDADGNQNYELIIELTSQKIFYLGLGISVMGSILSFVLFFRKPKH